MSENTIEVIVTNVMIGAAVICLISAIMSAVGLYVLREIPALDANGEPYPEQSNEVIRAWTWNWVTFICFPICGISGAVCGMCLFALHG